LEVWASDGAGERRLDASRRIDPKSLTLDASTLSWLNAGQRRYAVFE